MSAATYALALFLACMFTPHANAVPPTYTGEAPVNSQSDEERVDALKTALANVVIEQTGDPGVLSRSDVASAVGKAERYVLQFRYKRGATDGSGAPLILVAEFDSTAVDAMLQRLGLGANGRHRRADRNDAERGDGLDRRHPLRGRLRARHRAISARTTSFAACSRKQARGDGMLVRLSLATDLAHFLDAVGMERALSVVNAAPPVEGVDATLALGP